MKRFWILIFPLLLVACSSPAEETSIQKTAVQGAGLVVENAPVTGTALPTEISEMHPTPSPEIFRADYQDFGLAPELENETWLNTDQPLRLDDLRGQVVLVEMWTYG
jgi:hypothetical protein